MGFAHRGLVFLESPDREFAVMDVIFRPEAEAELIEAIEWQEARRHGPGGDLLRCIDAAIGKIERQPESSYPVVHRATRMALVRRFPYLVLYRVSGLTITVIAAFHAKRGPETWVGR